MDNTNTPKKKPVAVEVDDLQEPDAATLFMTDSDSDATIIEPTVVIAVDNAYTSRAVIGNADSDEVFLSKCVYKNKYARKSLTVHHLQRRLTELGYRNAVSDRDGWYGDLTALDVAAFQAANALDGEGQMNAATFEAVFAGDHNVTTYLD